MTNKSANEDDIEALLCEACGGDLNITHGAGDQIYGVCEHCDTKHLIKDLIKKHVVVEHRYSQPKVIPATGGPSAKFSFITLFVVSIVTTVFYYVVNNSWSESKQIAEPASDYEIKFVLSGEGSEIGQFRESPAILGIDAQEVVYLESSNRVQIFDKDDNLLTHRVFDESDPLHYFGYFPNGQLLTEGQSSENLSYAVIDGKTGNVVKDIDLPMMKWPDEQEANAIWETKGFSTRSDGKFELYLVQGNSREKPTKFHDKLLILDQDFKIVEEFNDLMTVFVPHNIEFDQFFHILKLEVQDFDIDMQGNRYILVETDEKDDLRKGVYIFNNANKLINKYTPPKESVFNGEIEVSAEGNIYYSQSWSGQIFDVKNNYKVLFDLADFSNETHNFGMIWQMVIYPNGDFGIVTGNKYYLRVGLKDDGES